MDSSTASLGELTEGPVEVDILTGPHVLVGAANLREHVTEAELSGDQGHRSEEIVPPGHELVEAAGRRRERQPAHVFTGVSTRTETPPPDTCTPRLNGLYLNWVMSSHHQSSILRRCVSNGFGGARPSPATYTPRESNSAAVAVAVEILEAQMSTEEQPMRRLVTYGIAFIALTASG